MYYSKRGCRYVYVTMAVCFTVVCVCDTVCVLRCSRGGVVSFRRADVTHLALFNLSIYSHQKYSEFDMAVMPWIHRHWDSLHVTGVTSRLNGTRDRFRNSLL